MLDNNFDVLNMVLEGIPHEFNHFIYEPTRENDPNRDTPLRLTIDEGFACYYTYNYFDGKISKAQAVEQMNKEDWEWYLQHEKDIYDLSVKEVLEKSQYEKYIGELDYN